VTDKTKYRPPTPTTRWRVGPSRGFTIPNPTETMMTSILATVLLAQETSSAAKMSPLVEEPVEFMDWNSA